MLRPVSARIRAITRIGYSRSQMARPIEVNPRKTPRQDRSRRMNELILEAAARVLAEGGPASFNTNRVAERAGISVGSLYQYYPNKAALLFRLYEQESSDTLGQLAGRLLNPSRPPRERLFEAVRTFFASEEIEVPLRDALSLSRVYYRESPEFEAVRERGIDLVDRFLASALPDAEGAPDRRFAAELCVTVLGSVSETLTQRGIRGPELLRWADACSEMLCRNVGL